MSEVTFDKHDYLAITNAGGWGRSKTVREAVRVARANDWGKPKEPSTGVWRLSDQTDTVRVDGFGSAFLDAGKAVKIAVFPHKTKAAAIPETMEPIEI